jgi:RimJ/RimL family protein N-acetyltransferase
VVNFQPININNNFELALILSWRSNPLIYGFFLHQNGPLFWEEHHNFWINRFNREDYFIIYFHRPIGHIALSKMNTEYPEISILIGETTLWGKGMATEVLSSFIEKMKNNGLRNLSAVIRDDNFGSKRLFEKNGFIFEKKLVNISEWSLYVLRLS